MKMIAPTTGGGKSALKRTSIHPVVSEMTAERIETPPIAPGPYTEAAAMQVVRKNGLGCENKGRPLPVRPPQACSAVPMHMAIRVEEMIERV